MIIILSPHQSFDLTFFSLSPSPSPHCIEAVVYMFGSSASNLCAKDSDIDLSILCPEKDEVKVIKTIQSLLKKCGMDTCP